MWKKVLRFLEQWLIYFLITEVMYYFFWYVLNKQVFMIQDEHQPYFLVDTLYGAFFSVLILLNGRLAHHIFRYRVGNYPYLIAVMTIVGAINIAIAYCSEFFFAAIVYGKDTAHNSADVYIYSLIGVILSTLVLSRVYYRQLEQHLRQLRKLELNQLKGQLDPHFLFNNLSTLNSLIDVNPTVAHAFLNKLSHVYRYFTKYITMDLVTIEEEINFLREYQALQEIRHEGHILFEVDVELDEYHHYIPSMTAQVLTENAIKHNKHSVQNPISINYRTEDGYLIVRNRVNLRANMPGVGSGLNNLRERCRLFTSKPLIVNKTDEYFEVKVPIIEKVEDESISSRG